MCVGLGCICRGVLRALRIITLTITTNNSKCGTVNVVTVVDNAVTELMSSLLNSEYCRHRNGECGLFGTFALSLALYLPKNR